MTAAPWSTANCREPSVDPESATSSSTLPIEPLRGHGLQHLPEQAAAVEHGNGDGDGISHLVA